MVADGKKRHVVSYENMSEEVAEAFDEKYPKGLNDCLDDVVKYPKPDGTSFYAVTIETADGIYLVKVQVETDDADDLQRWLDGEEEAVSEQMTGASEPNGEGESLPDDNISQYGGGDDDPSDSNE